MKEDQLNTKETLYNLLNFHERNRPLDLDYYYNKFYEANRGAVLRAIADTHKYRAIKSCLIDNDLNAMRQNFYTASRLFEAARAEGFNTDFKNTGAPLIPLLCALLSDCTERIRATAEANLAYKDNPKSYHFYSRMLQLLLLEDHTALREMIAIGIKKCGKPFRDELAEGRDFISLVLARNQAGLESYIFNKTKIKMDIVEGDFLAVWAVVYAKICWLKGIKVVVDHPLVPMSLMPIEPLPEYRLEYDFLHPDWQPPKPGVMLRLKRWWL